jgi:hypothetical protein
MMGSKERRFLPLANPSLEDLGMIIEIFSGFPDAEQEPDAS